MEAIEDLEVFVEKSENEFGKSYVLELNENKVRDLLIAFEERHKDMARLIGEYLSAKRNIKACINFRAVMQPPWGGMEHIWFYTKYKVILNESSIGEYINSVKLDISNKIDNYTNRGSDWHFITASRIDLKCVVYLPMNAGKFIDLPKLIRNKQAIINVKNKDNECFKWAILSALHPVGFKDHPQLVSKYHAFQNELDFAGIEFPVKIKDIKKFENQNVNLSVNVYGITDDIDRYEKQYQKGTLEDDIVLIYPLYVSDYYDRQHNIDLILIRKGEDSHYAWIKDISRLVRHYNKHHGVHHMCRRCLHVFSEREYLDNHVEYCRGLNEACQVPIFKEGSIEFKNYKNIMMVPFIIVFDFECFNVPEHKPLGQSRFTNVMFNQVPNSFCYIIVRYDGWTSEPYIYRGSDAASEFVKRMIIEQNNIKYDYFAENGEKRIKYEHRIVKEERKKYKVVFEQQTNCYVCSIEFDNKDHMKCFDHCHITGKYRGAACKQCNFAMQINEQTKIPVLAHNLKHYDGHIVASALGLVSDITKIKCIAQNMETYISFGFYNIQFKDSFMFLSTGLDTLIKNLDASEMHITKKYIPDRMYPFMKAKSVYPYEWVSSAACFDYNGLPPIELFYSHLSQSNLKQTDYDQGVKEYGVLECKNFGDFHDYYLKKDVLQLADIIQSYRRLSVTNYGLDPMWYYSLPHIAWDAMLKKTGISLDYISDMELHDMIESGLRGGISMCSKRKSVANNPLCPDFDETKPRTYISYLDANNLYGGCMCMPLPTGSFKKLNIDETLNDEQIKLIINTQARSIADNLDQLALEFPIATIDYNTLESIGNSVSFIDVLKTADDSETGYVLVIDAEFPPELHALFNDYPIMPEKIEVKENMLSPYQNKLLTQDKCNECNLITRSNIQCNTCTLTKCNECEFISCRSCGFMQCDKSQFIKCKKMVLSLLKKEKYTIHYRNLKLYIQLGLRVTKVHQIWSFNQSNFMKEKFIDFNTTLRQKAKSSFEQDFYKLKNNATFGKSMENKRKRQNVRLINSKIEKKRYMKYVTSTSFVDKKEFDGDLCALRSASESIKLDKPIYVGFAVLELSKLVMYEFWYFKIKAKYGNKAKLLYTDTDSLVFEVETHDLYDDMLNSSENYDLSNYPTDHKCFDTTNKKVVLKMKDEAIKDLADSPLFRTIHKFIGLRPKVYNVLFNTGETKAKAKGVTKATLKRLGHAECSGTTLDRYGFELYERCLEETTTRRDINYSIRSFNHKNTVIELNKKSLSSLDTKRYICDDGINTLAYGHVNIS
jgi:hypothetical protein